MISAFYINYFIIAPRFFLSGKRIRFFIILLGLTFTLSSLSFFLMRQLNFRPGPPPPLRRMEKKVEKVLTPKARKNMRHSHLFILHPQLYSEMLLFIMVLGFSTGMAVIQRLNREEKAQKEMERARVETELAFLKNQISPHFFFNSLNNIYALITIDSAEAQKVVEKLSSLMRYLIYDSDVKTVELSKEFEFTRNYIDLMKKRLSSKVKIAVDIQQNVPDIEIPPLIFIPFVENAFKHGISYRENSFIGISLKITDKSIQFSCKNSIPKTSTKVKTENRGVGIANIEKRLALLYGDTAQLNKNIKNDVFEVCLNIPIRQDL
jgi:LytS/YehU family sensor histidine kinase